MIRNCPPHVYLTSRTWLFSKAFPLRFCILQAIKNWKWEWPGNESSTVLCTMCVSLFPRLSPRAMESIMYVACSFVRLIHSTVGAKAHHISCSSKKHWHNLKRRDKLSVAVKLIVRMLNTSELYIGPFSAATCTQTHVSMYVFSTKHTSLFSVERIKDSLIPYLIYNEREVWSPKPATGRQTWHYTLVYIVNTQ